MVLDWETTQSKFQFLLKDSEVGRLQKDGGEDVSYTVQLIVLDFEITPYVEIEDL